MAVLLRGEAVDAVEKNGAVVVRDKVGFPSLEQFFFQMVNNVCRDQTLNCHVLLTYTELPSHWLPHWIDRRLRLRNSVL